MRPASRNPKSAQTRPHVKPLKPNKHTTKKEKKKEKEEVSKAATLKILRVIKRHPNNNKKVKKYG